MELPRPVDSVIEPLFVEGRDGPLAEAAKKPDAGSDANVESVRSFVADIGADLGDVGASEASLTRATLHVHDVNRDGISSAVVTTSVATAAGARSLLKKLNRDACSRLNKGK